MKILATLPLLIVDDINTSVDFYCNLGFQLSETWKPNGQLAWCRLKHGDAGVMLQQVCKEDPPAEQRVKGVSLFFLCEDAETYYHEISQRGVEATAPKTAFYGMKQVFVRDPDGYELCFENPTNTTDN